MRAVAGVNTGVFAGERRKASEWARGNMYTVLFGIICAMFIFGSRVELKESGREIPGTIMLIRSDNHVIT